MVKESFKQIVIDNNCPITLLGMVSIANENTNTKPKLSIFYLDGITLISHDFYKHISTY